MGRYQMCKKQHFCTKTFERLKIFLFCIFFTYFSPFTITVTLNIEIRSLHKNYYFKLFFILSNFDFIFIFPFFIFTVTSNPRSVTSFFSSSQFFKINFFHFIFTNS